MMMAHKIVDIRKTIPKHPTKKWKKRKTADTIVVHTTASDNQDPVKTALYHITPSKDNLLCKTGAPCLAYADYITKDGTLYHCNNYTDITWHAGLYNTRSIGVVVAYKGQDGIAPEPPQMKTLEEHLAFLCLYLHILPQSIIGHREVPGMFEIVGKGIKKYKKNCPGLAIDMDILRKTVAVRVQVLLAAKGLYKNKVDGLFGPKSKAALYAFKPSVPVDWVYGQQPPSRG